MSSANTMRALAGAGQFDVHPLVATGATFEAELLSRSGIFFYDHITAAGSVTATLPNLSDDQCCVGFIRNRSGQVLVLVDVADTLELTMADDEGACVMWIGGTTWAASIMKSATIT